MPKTVYDLAEAQNALSELVDRAAAGEEIVIFMAGEPRAKLVAFRRAVTLRKPGGWEGQVRISDDFDDPVAVDLQRLAEWGRLRAFKGNTVHLGSEALRRTASRE